MQRGQRSVPPRFARPPVRIGPDQSTVQLFSMLAGSQRYSSGAGGLGRKALASMPIPLRLQVVSRNSAGPNSQANIATIKPLGRTSRKQGYTTDTTTLFPTDASS